MSVMHYCGGLRIREKNGYVTTYGSGWAACCSGERCMAIKQFGQSTYAKERVTCKTCLRQMKRAEQSVAKRGKRDSEGGS